MATFNAPLSYFLGALSNDFTLGAALVHLPQTLSFLVFSSPANKPREHCRVGALLCPSQIHVAILLHLLARSWITKVEAAQSNWTRRAAEGVGPNGQFSRRKCVS